MTENEFRDLLTFARMEARKCVKERWRSEGVKLLEWDQRQLRIASEQYLADHWAELKPKAEEYLRYSKAQDEAKRRKRSVQKDTGKQTLALRLAQKIKEVQS